MSETLTSDDKLDDVMLAMDVVDTLRHEQIMLEKDLAVDDRRQNLIERLRGIYKAQGIEVPDAVLMDGVMALEEQRFAFEPAKPGFGTRLAKLYIGRKKWLPLIYTVGFIIGSVLLINYVGFVRPQQVEAKRVETLLSRTLPADLQSAYDKASNVAATETLKANAENMYQAGLTAIDNQDVQRAENAAKNLEQYAADLAQAYTLRIVSRPGEYSGVFRINDDGGSEVRNYYLIVEGITASGERMDVMIRSEEDQKSARTNIWGIRVPEDIFNAVAADKQDDQIIQNARIGEKKRGYLQPDYSVETSGGLILDW